MGAVTSQQLLFSLLSISTVLSACLSYVLLNYNLGSVAWLVTVSSAFFSLLLSILTLDIIRQRPASSHTPTTLLRQYLEFSLFSIVGYVGHKLYMPRLKCCKETQIKTLLNILSKNADSEHGRKMGFDDIKTREEYVARHPLVDYEYYRDYVHRLYDGEKHLLSMEDIVFWAVTSGTTGKNKLFPIEEGSRRRFLLPMFNFLGSWMKYANLKRLMELRPYTPVRKSPTGLPVGNSSSYYARPRAYDIPPPCCQRIYQEQQTFYVQGLFFLAEKEVGAIQTVSSIFLYSFFKFLEHNIDSLCDDIARGNISREVLLAEDIRQAVNHHLKADVQRAEEVRQAFEEGPKCLAKRLWPHVTYLMTLKTGGFAHCAKLLDESYTATIPQLSHLHPASEGMLGINVERDLTTENFSPNLTSIFFEFIPEEGIAGGTPKTVFMDQVEVGKCYELVLTTHGGLYRYRLGDVVKITHFKYNTPQYKFQYRVGQLLNCSSERTPESLVYEAVNRLQDECPDIKVVDYTCTESVILESVTGEASPVSKYIVFMELANGCTSVNESHSAKMDIILCSVHEAYNTSRQRGRVGQLNIVQVAMGTFSGLRTLLMGDTVNQQFKMPRVLRKEHGLEYLMGRKVDSISQSN